MTDNIIQIDHLYKSYGSVRAVQDISFCVKRGELFAFLGINGAGKSTTIHILCGQLAQDSGTVLIDGKDIAHDRKEILRTLGVVFQNSVLDAALTVRDNLKSRAALYGLSGKAFQARLDELKETLDFADLLDRPLVRLSGGQRRRIDIARALLSRPHILILDEPTTGLDPQTRKMLWGVVSRLRKEEGMTVFLTTHYMEEAADADYVVLIDAGKIVAKGTPLELKNSYAGDYVTLYHADEEKVRALGVPYERIRDALRLSLRNTEEATQLILSHPDLFRDYEITKGKLDDVFLAVTGKRLEERT